MFTGKNAFLVDVHGDDGFEPSAPSLCLKERSPEVVPSSVQVVLILNF